MSNSERIDIFTEEGVVLLNWHGDTYKFNHKVGKLIITEYVNSQGNRFIEWIPSYMTIVTENCDHDEWSMVNAKLQKERSSSLHSSSSSVAPETTFVLNIKSINYFEVSSKINRLRFFSLQHGLLADFLFQYGNAEKTITMFRSIVATVRLTRFMYNVIDSNEDTDDIIKLRKSFYELNLFPEQNDRFGQQFLRDLRDNPYETTMIAFSKITNFVFSPKLENRPEISDVPLKDVESIKSNDSIQLSEEYEMINSSPKLSPPMEIYRSEPLSLEKWTILQNPDGQFNDVPFVKDLIFRGGISTELRGVAWKFLLGLYPWDSTFEERLKIRQNQVVEYEIMRRQWETISSKQENNNSMYCERKALIDKDVIRTDRCEEFFAGDNNPNLLKLRNILMTYMMYNFNIGYSQGMNDCLVPILYNINDEIDSFWCFVSFIDKIKNNFGSNIDGILKQIEQLRTLIAFMYPVFMAYLQRKNADNLYFCFRWLLVWFKREFRSNDVMLLWEVLWTGLPCPNFHLLICLAILSEHKDYIIRNNYDFNSILKYINDLANKMDPEEILKKAEAIYSQLAYSPDVTDEIRLIIGLSQNDSKDNAYDNENNGHDSEDNIEAECEKGLQLFF